MIEIYGQSHIILDCAVHGFMVCVETETNYDIDP